MRYFIALLICNGCKKKKIGFRKLTKILLLLWFELFFYNSFIIYGWYWASKTKFYQNYDYSFHYPFKERNPRSFRWKCVDESVHFIYNTQLKPSVMLQLFVLFYFDYISLFEFYNLISIQDIFNLLLSFGFIDMENQYNDFSSSW